MYVPVLVYNSFETVGGTELFGIIRENGGEGSILKCPFDKRMDIQVTANDIAVTHTGDQGSTETDGHETIDAPFIAKAAVRMVGVALGDCSDTQFTAMLRLRLPKGHLAVLGAESGYVQEDGVEGDDGYVVVHIALLISRDDTSGEDGASGASVHVACLSQLKALSDLVGLEVLRLVKDNKSLMTLRMAKAAAAEPTA